LKDGSAHCCRTGLRPCPVHRWQRPIAPARPHTTGTRIPARPVDQSAHVTRTVTVRSPEDPVAARAPALLCHAMAEIVHSRLLSPFIDVSLHGVEREPFTRYSVLVVFFLLTLPMTVEGDGSSQVHGQLYAPSFSSRYGCPIEDFWTLFHYRLDGVASRICFAPSSWI
jgi:hypothetical protein